MNTQRNLGGTKSGIVFIYAMSIAVFATLLIHALQALAPEFWPDFDLLNPYLDLIPSWVLIFLSVFVLVYGVTSLLLLKRQDAFLKTHDQLTGLLNRRHIIESCEPRFVPKHLSARAPMSIALFNIDRFKYINAEHGFTTGDDILISVASTLRASTREKKDVIGRWNGDEFIAVLECGSESDVNRVCRRIRSTIETMDFGFHESTPIRCTVRAGFAVAETNESFSDVLRRAEQALTEGASLTEADETTAPRSNQTRQARQSDLCMAG